MNSGIKPPCSHCRPTFSAQPSTAHIMAASIWHLAVGNARLSSEQLGSRVQTEPCTSQKLRVHHGNPAVREGSLEHRLPNHRGAEILV